MKTNYNTIISYLKYAFKTFDNLGNYSKIENKINENSDALYEKYFEKDNKTKFSLSDINLSESDYSNVNNKEIAYCLKLVFATFASSLYPLFLIIGTISAPIPVSIPLMFKEFLR